MKHTPGPWEVQTSCSWRRIGTPGHDGNVICPTVNPRDGHPDLIASEADLQLAAAAPDLLEALEEMLKAASQQRWSLALCNRAQDAIAKASGEK